MGKKILIVDDEPDILRVVMFRLKKAGYEVVCAVDGKAAIETAEKEMPDMIFLDIRLPLLSGFEVCQHLKQSEKLKNIPVVFLSASVSENIDAQIKELGANDYLRKPFEPEDLFVKINKHLGPEQGA